MPPSIMKKHCISKKTTGWSEFSSTIAYALVCLATSRKFNFSKMVINDFLSNLDTKSKSFYMYPRFVQALLNKELTDLPHFNEVYVPKVPKGKMFSNMRRTCKVFSGIDAPLFSTMMIVSPTHGEASVSKPSSDNQTDDLPTPLISINIPPSLLKKPTSPITHTYIRKKVKKVPSLLVPSPTKPSSPIMEHSPLENIQRETTGVSPNPKKVLNKEKEEHMGCKAHTTDFAQSAGQDSVNISKTFPMATLGEQSSRDPRCQETKGVEGASARQRTPTKSSSDLPRVGKLIEEIQIVILSQQVQISKLKKMVLKHVQKKKRTKFIMKKRSIPHDASKEGDNRAESEKQSPLGMDSTFEGEKGKEAETSTAVETEPEVETFKKAASIGLAAETEATVTRLSIEEIEIAETLLKAKTSTPKATQKAKGVEIKEGGPELKRKEISEAELKRKGKAKAELQQEEEPQKAKDRQIALDLSIKLNEVYQKSLKAAAEAKKSTVKASKHKMQAKIQKRQPSKTYLANQERRKMINFLKGSIGVKEEMFASMSYNRVEELYKREVAKLQGDFTQRVEFERQMKERHDLNIQQPFPEIISAKRVKTIASKKLSKKPRVAEAEKETEPSVTGQADQSSQSAQQPSQSDVHFELYMTVTDNDPVKADPISVQAPEIIHWDILVDQGKEYFRIKRMGDHFEVYSTWGKIVRCCSKSDLEEIFKVGMNLYGDMLKTPGMNIMKLAMEYLCMMFSPDLVKHVIKDVFKYVDNWMLIERCGVYIFTIDKSFHEYYLVDKIYDHSLAKLHGMLKAKLICPQGSEMARIVGEIVGSEMCHGWLLLLDMTITTAISQLLLLEGVNDAETKLILLDEINTASSELILLMKIVLLMG
ncbi:hypothetical protein L6452_19025 [Arctium lappa]|uniref:Uncharacterized protein n=1 Tax=Arctium lappa TaxID=4217 RepID=A0ACB9B891_ARCLA|nr:hypothetical protein L6452_19025 [Arctium lappa]